MSWTLSIGVAVALLAVCGGQNTVNEENNLSPSGYHLCTHNETRTVSFLEVHEVPYSVSKPCGGWLLWKMCAVTIYRMIHQTKYKTVTDQVIGCCHGYVQVGRYCALPVNRSGEFSSKPGSCPTADGLRPSAEDCELDIDCPGLQKCCQRSGHSFCSDPATNYSENGGNRLNATVTVKIDYQQMMSKNEGLLNHTRLLQAMVTGALQSEVSVYYLSTQPVCPYRTATSLLIDCSFTLSLFNVTSKLHLLLKRIEEASSITVQDVDECAHSALHQCSLQADCNNTVGSYQCACRQGYVDVDPSNPGAHCSADFGVSTTMEPTLPNLPLTNSAYPPASNSTHGPHGNNTTDFFNPSETSMTTAPSNTTSVPYNSSPASLWTNSASYGQVNSTVESPLPVTTCSPPSISSLWSANVTGTSFSVSWSGWSQINQTYVVVLSMSSEVIQIQETSDTMIEVSELNPGLLYKVAVTPCACGNQGVTLHIAVKTDAQTLQATARLTNINFTADLQNTSSQAYQNLSESIIQEIYQSLSPEMRAMVDSGQVEIEIRSFSPGSVVVDFSIVFIPSQNQSISNVSTAVLHSLMNSVKYTVDKNNTSINDINECASGENDCSQWATCNNTWGSYTCVCLVGFTDNNPERPGRACQVATFETVTPALTTGITASTTEPTVTTATAAPEITTDNTSKGQTSSTTVSSTAQATTTTTPVTSTPPTATPAITTTAPRTTTNSLSITTTTNDSILGDFSVHCRVAAITVTITKNFLLSSKIQESALYLGKLGCGINGGNDTHVELTVAWDECDTKLVHNETHYIASVSLFNTMDPYVSPSGAEEVPSKQLKVPIMCAYMKSMLISADFSVMGNEMIDELIMGSWSPQVTMQLMNGTVPLPHNYSLSHQQPVVVEVRLNTSSDQIKLIINKCWATPTENPADTSSYVFLMNSCSLNTHTKVLTNGNSSTSRLSVQIFSFVSLTVIYLHCEIQICLPTKSYTCVPDCLQRSTRSANAVGIGFRSVGPLMSSEEGLLDAKLSTLHVVGFSFLGIGLSLFFIGSLACLLYCQRNRIGHYNFNVKPKEENFTYLVFNT
ncbi:uromodulin-like 1 [Archocentrus centrarchus]|uniref:uromodulin-like 1 n=1 Tax=Archocentrus centrarchus TaxID=63155 RepID=UPI0011EA23EC|nr:uromodulin-like 1 [Archocentrus centrarchus]